MKCQTTANDMVEGWLCVRSVVGCVHIDDRRP
jgi:hypothetical protein